MSLEYIRDEILRIGLQRKENGAVLISKSGFLQHWLLDLREILLQRDSLIELASLFWDRYRSRERFQIAVMETAAIPLLAALLICRPDERGSINGFIVRKQRKTTGRGNSIEGEITDDPVIFVDDVLNSASTAERARVTIEAHGARIAELFVVVDFHSTKGKSWRERHNITVTSLFALADFSLTLLRDPSRPKQQYKSLWRRTISGGYPYFVVPKSTPLLAGERIFRGCDTGKMHAFDTLTGDILWEYQATGTSPRKGIWSSPAYHDGRLYFGAYNGSVYCLDAADGTEVWVQGYGEWVGASPLVVPKHGLVYFGIEYVRPWARGSVGALDMRTGEKVWEYQTKGLQHGSPSYWAGGDLVLWGTADHEMVAFDAATGEIRWVFRTGRSVKYPPAVCEERKLVAFASFDKSIYVLDPATGAKLGQWVTGEICYTTPLIHNGRLFCGSGDRHLYVVDLDQMALIKKIDLGARVYSSPRAAGRHVIVGTNGGNVVEINVETLKIDGRLDLPDAVTNAVVLSPDSRSIFVSTYMNHLYAFERL